MGISCILIRKYIGYIRGCVKLYGKTSRNKEMIYRRHRDKTKIPVESADDTVYALLLLSPVISFDPFISHHISAKSFQSQGAICWSSVSTDVQATAKRNRHVAMCRNAFYILKY
jgi:hypothetical protein